MLDRQIYLIGMPGSGKSSLGRRAARETGLPFTDLDSWIEERAGITIPEIFEKYGEEGRVLIRPSGTEPKIRVMIEGRNQAEIEVDAQKLATLIEKRAENSI